MMGKPKKEKSASSTNPGEVYDEYICCLKLRVGVHCIGDHPLAMQCMIMAGHHGTVRTGRDEGRGVWTQLYLSHNNRNG